MVENMSVPQIIRRAVEIGNRSGKLSLTRIRRKVAFCIVNYLASFGCILNMKILAMSYLGEPFSGVIWGRVSAPPYSI